MDFLFGLFAMPALWTIVLGLVVAAIVCQFLPGSVSCGEVGAWIVGIFFACGLIYDLV